MSHDSGFRRNDHDSTHGPTMTRRHRSKASQHLEEHMRRKRERKERLGRLIETQQADEEP